MNKYYVTYGPHRIIIMAVDAIDAAARVFGQTNTEKMYDSFIVDERGFSDEPRDGQAYIALAFLMGMWYERANGQRIENHGN